MVKVGFQLQVRAFEKKPGFLAHTLGPCQPKVKECQVNLGSNWSVSVTVLQRGKPKPHYSLNSPQVASTRHSECSLIQCDFIVRDYEADNQVT
ncbi:hypothetical protein [Pseudophaeobacter sp.]|uniref:hypothetical protein n=1 Tax=Pseudophaeobacter sp. TaxID=1971739 RepID=UPI003299D5E6